MCENEVAGMDPWKEWGLVKLSANRYGPIETGLRASILKI